MSEILLKAEGSAFEKGVCDLRAVQKPEETLVSCVNYCDNSAAGVPKAEEAEFSEVGESG